MDYAATLRYLYEHLPMFSRIGAVAYKKDLTNTLLLCDALGNPHKKIKTIHIAGTNGKGSVSHMLAAILQQSGYKTGLYTSPHLKDFRERIKVNGVMCEEHFVIDFTERMIPLIEKIQPSFFEITVAMALDYFEKQGVDIAVIETGLGGRLDSTNIITPELSVITNIGWDHMNILGDTLQKIAFEKAGIIKDNIPVIIGETIPESKDVFETAAAGKNAPIHFASNEFLVTDWKHDHHHLNIAILKKSNQKLDNYLLDLTGIYQTKNICTVLSTVQQLNIKGWHINYDALKEALAVTRKLNGLHGRWEQLQSNPAVIADVAHNIDGIKQVTEQLELMNYYRLHIIIGMVKDKEVEKVLALLPAHATYYFTKAQIPRALPAEELAAKGLALNLKGDVYPDVNIALKMALKNATKEDLILVCGSVFLVGEITYL